MNAMDFDDLLVRDGQRLELFPEVREPLRARLPPRARRRVPGHEPRPVPAAAAARRRAPQPLRWSATTTSRSTASAAPTSATSSTSRTTSPTRTVVKLEQNYRSTQTILDAANAVIAHNRGRMRQDAVDRPRRGRPDQGPRARRRARRGALRRGRDRAAGRRGRLARGDRRLLPHERAVARARGHARAPRDRLPGHRRHEVLRARGDQGRDRLPDRARQPAGRRRFTRVANSPQRGIGQTSLSRVARPRRRRWASRSGRRPPTPRRCRAWAPRRSARSGASWRRWTALRERAEERRPGRRPARGAARTRPATSRRSRPSARSRPQGRLENLAGARRGRARVRRRRRRGGRRPLDVFLQQIALVADAGHAQRRRGPRHADDAAQRQGPRVPDRLHDRLRGGRLPALALDRRGRARGGAAPLLRRDHAGDARPVPDATRAGAACSARGGTALPSRFLGEIPPDLARPRRRSLGTGVPRRAAAARSPAGRRRGPRRAPTAPSATFRLGEDVVHAGVRRGRGDRGGARRHGRRALRRRRLASAS